MDNLLELDEPFEESIKTHGVIVYHTEHNDTLCPKCALETVHLNVHEGILIVDPIVSTEIDTTNEFVYCDGCHKAIVETPIAEMCFDFMQKLPPPITGVEIHVPPMPCNE